jgi:hypothetical protein
LLLSAYELTHSTKSKTASQSSSSSTTSKSNQRVGKDGFTGLYRMVRPKMVGVGLVTEYIAFLPGGHVFWALPSEGLLYFDPAVAQKAHPNNWGTYEIRGDEIHVLRGPGKDKYVLTRKGERLNNPPSLGKGSFRPVPSADGLVLEGTYRRGETSPAITFTKDGGFS